MVGAGNAPTRRPSVSARAWCTEPTASPSRRDSSTKSSPAPVIANCQPSTESGAKALEKAGKSIDDVERVELNEAFSSVALNSTKMLGADPEKVNVNGGAVALGHPIGASGARILGTMIYELRRNGGGLGLAAICSGGGQGDALLIEV